MSDFNRFYNFFIHKLADFTAAQSSIDFELNFRRYIDSFTKDIFDYFTLNQKNYNRIVIKTIKEIIEDGTKEIT